MGTRFARRLRLFASVSSACSAPSSPTIDTLQCRILPPSRTLELDDMGNVSKLAKFQRLT